MRSLFWSARTVSSRLPQACTLFLLTGLGEFWFGRILGSEESGLFPAACVQKKWAPPLSGRGEHDVLFRSFPLLPASIRESIYSHFFDLRPEAAIRAVTLAEYDEMDSVVSRSLHYADTSRATVRTDLLFVSNLFRTCRFVTEDLLGWVTRTFTLRVLTYPTNPAYRGGDDFSDPTHYPPRAFRATLPVIQLACVSRVTRLDIDITYLLDIPRLLAAYCGGIDIGSLRVTFRSCDNTTEGQGYYRLFPRVVAELERLDADGGLWWQEKVCVRGEVEIVWVEMEETFAGYPAADREIYCAGYLGPVRAIASRLNQNWAVKYAPWTLPGGA